MERDRRERASGSTDGADDRTDGDRCTNCGARIDTAEWHPVETARDADGELVLVQFCTEACRDAWSES